MLQTLGRRFVDATARRPAGWIGRSTYGARDGAPRGHEPVFDRVLEAAGPLQGLRVLEIGCGGGRLLERVLAGGAASAAGLDHSPDMLALTIARNRAAVADDRLRVKLGDAAELPWPDASFDLALSANMFFFVERPQQTLEELFRVLVPGGRLVVSTAPGPLPKPSLENWWVAVWGSALRVYDEDQMRAMYERAGFEDVRVETEGLGQLSRGTRPAAG